MLRFFHRITCIGCVTALLFGAVGCQATPDEDYVQLKDQERLVETAKAESTAENSAGIVLPEYTAPFSAENDSGTLLVTMGEIPVEVPDANLSIVRVTADAFTDDEADGMVHILLGNDAVVVPNTEAVLTKSDIEKLIVTYRGYIAEGSVDENTIYTEEELLEEIDRLEAEYQDAPETAPDNTAAPFDGTMTSRESEAGIFNEVYVTDPEEKSMLSIVSPQDVVQSSLTSGVYYLQDQTAAPDDSVDRRAELGESFPETGLSYDEALSLCQNFLNAAGASDAVPAAERLVDLGSGPAYALTFVRSVNGVPAAYFPPVYDPAEDETVPWDYENIEIVAGESGIQFIDWRNLTAASEVLTENAQILPYEEAQEVFEKMILAVYEPQTEWLDDDAQIEVNVDNVSLAPIRVREAGSDGKTGLYVPAWLYYGTVRNPAEKASALDEDDQRLLLAVNAVDGSIIDLRRGY